MRGGNAEEVGDECTNVQASALFHTSVEMRPMRQPAGVINSSPVVLASNGGRRCSHVSTSVHTRIGVHSCCFCFVFNVFLCLLLLLLLINTTRPITMQLSGSTPLAPCGQSRGIRAMPSLAVSSRAEPSWAGPTKNRRSGPHLPGEDRAAATAIGPMATPCGGKVKRSPSCVDMMRIDPPYAVQAVFRWGLRTVSAVKFKKKYSNT